MLYKLIIWRGESRCGRRRGPRSAGCWSPASLGASQSSSSMSGHDESGTRPVSGATHFQENGKALEGVHGSIIFLKVSAFHRHGIICIISWKYSFHVDISVKLRALSF